MGAYQQGQPIEIVDSFTVGGVLTDPTEITYSIIGPDGVITTYVWPGAAEITHVGTGEFTLSLAPPADPGEYHYDVDATGDVEASRSATFTILPNAVTGPDVPWAVDGPCSAWCDSQDVWEGCGRPTTTIGEGSNSIVCDVDMTPYAMMGSWLLWEMSGRLFNGRCTRTVRPCSDNPCGFQVLSRGHIVWPGANLSGWGDYGWTGWDWYFDGWEGCGCVPLSRIRLSGYPVREILTVKIDGVEIPEFDLGGSRNWRLDERRFLTRMADANGNAQRWPACQRLDEDDTEVGTFSVEYAYGQDPSLLGARAAAQMGCEFYKAFTGDECQLPSGTVRVTRQGIVVDKLAALGFFKQSSNRYGPQARWATGLPLVDAFLNAANPYGLTRRPMIMSPGNRRGRYAQSVGQG